MKMSPQLDRSLFSAGSRIQLSSDWPSPWASAACHSALGARQCGAGGGGEVLWSASFTSERRMYFDEESVVLGLLSLVLVITVLLV